MTRTTVRFLFALLVVGGSIYRARGGFPPAVDLGSPPAESTGAESGGADERVVLDAFAARRSDVEVEVAGSVQRILADDETGSRHQRFILELPSSHTLLVSHNIDLAPRVPLRTGDILTVRGEYEWNERGGVLHWTHHDPRGEREGGGIRHRGRVYR